MRAGRLTLLLAAAAVVAAASACGQSPAKTAPAAADVPDQVRLVCNRDGSRLLTPVARPQRDGLHLLLVNRGPAAALSVGDAGENAPHGRSRHVLVLPPGRVRVGCLSDRDLATDPPDRSGLVALTVSDPRGVWIPDHLSCRRASIGISDHVAGARGLRRGLAADARRALGARPGDRVGPAGYPAARVRELRLVRDGRVLGTVTYAPDGHGGWLRDSVTRCV